MMMWEMNDIRWAISLICPSYQLFYAKGILGLGASGTLMEVSAGKWYLVQEDSLKCK